MGTHIVAIIPKIAFRTPSGRCSRRRNWRQSRGSRIGWVEGDPTPALSCLNLSYSYDDAWDACDLEELELTAAWVYHTCLGCFGPSLVASSARVAGKGTSEQQSGALAAKIMRS